MSATYNYVNFDSAGNNANRRRAVASAARRLDSQWSGWAERMPETFDMEDPNDCVLYHAAGSFWDAGPALGAYYESHSDLFYDARWTPFWWAEIQKRLPEPETVRMDMHRAMLTDRKAKRVGHGWARIAMVQRREDARGVQLGLLDDIGLELVPPANDGTVEVLA